MVQTRLLGLLLVVVCTPSFVRAAEKPNLIFVLSDDVAQGDLGAYGQQLIQTPHLDRLCREGTRYLSAYTGTSVCAPARSSFFTGLDTGHCPIRGNREIQPEGQRPLPANTVTIAKILKAAGYRTAAMGKWGMGMFDTSGSPLKNGIDHFFGYNCQRHAHSYFPTYLYNDAQRVEIPENAGGKKQVYAQNLIQREVLRWVEENAGGPFFLFYAVTLPHGRFEIDDQGIYRDKPWTEQEKNYAAMVTRLDADVGGLVALLERKGLAKKTLLVFAGDNGSSFNPNTPIGRRFNQAMDGKLRGYKRGMYEGALRQAAFAWWPGTVPAGRVTDEPWAFWDLLPTFAELAGARIPEGFRPDGHSLVQFLEGGPAPRRDYFYWELHEGRNHIQALRWGRWKAVRPVACGPVEIYDLSRDPGETTNLAAARPDLVAGAVQQMHGARTADPAWPDPATAAPPKRKARRKPAAPVVQVRNLRCEYRTDPRGIDVRSPRLGWIIQSSRRGVLQSAYRVLVASSAERLARDEGDLWDSGRVSSRESAHVVYRGKPLSSRMECFWKVRVWRASGDASPWSRPASWTMGLLEPADWKAEWIGCKTPQGGAPAGGYFPAPFFRKPFEARGGIRRATVYATAAGVYELWINGHRVGTDWFTPGWTEYSVRLYYQTYDVTDLLRPGAPNVLGATLADGWYGLRHHGRGKLRLKAQMEIEYADGSRDIIATDASWKTTREGPILQSDIYNGEVYDARRELGGWSAPGHDDASWQAVLAGADTAGSQGTWADATQKVRQAVRGGALSIEASNGNFGDPIYGTPKVLRVTYRLGNVTKTKTVPEGQVLEIRPAGRQGNLEILKAEYGAASVSSAVSSAALQAYPGSPVRAQGEILPVDLKQPKPGVWVFNMGQNFSGRARLEVEGAAGTKVTLRFAEMLNPDGTIYTKNLRGAKCTDTYILRGGGREVWEPRFTFRGFQYVEVTGYPGKPPRSAVTGVVLYSDCPAASTFECSSPMLNKLYSNIVWGQRSNYLEVPTDCPQRDERLGWTGDAQAFIGTAAYNMDVAAFFTSWLITLNDSQREDGGYTDVSPGGRGVSAGWSDAGVICPWTIWKRYGDTRIIKAHYRGMARWIKYCTTHSKDLLRPAEGYGDWLNVKAEMPKDVIATAYFAYSTKLLAEMAEAIGRKNDAASYRELFAKIRDAFNKAYVAGDGRIKGDTQTTYLMALAFDLLPPAKKIAARKLLIERIRQRDWHLSTGFLGVNLLLPTLTAIGRTDVAYRLLENTTYPSWGYPVLHGATTIWERWDGWTEEKGFQNPGMNSFNHYAYGSCGEWMFSTVAGIDTDGPGFQKILIRPRPGGSLRYVRAGYDSIHGRVAAEWDCKGKAFSLRVEIPANTTATVFVPARDAACVTEGGRAAAEVRGVKFIRWKDGAAVYAVGSGKYAFASEVGD